MKKILILFISLMAGVSFPLYANGGLYQSSNTKIDKQRSILGTYVPMSYSSGNFRASGRICTPQASFGGIQSLRYGSFTSADAYITGAVSATPTMSKRKASPGMGGTPGTGEAGDGTPTDPNSHQGYVPIADCTWLLVLLMVGYMVVRRKRACKAETT